MKTAGEAILSELKSETLLKRKPFLKVCSNHRREHTGRVYRMWTSGTAYSDGTGWYLSKKKPEIKFKDDLVSFSGKKS